MAAHLDENTAERPVYVLLGDQSLDTHGFLNSFARQTQLGTLAKAFARQASHALAGLVEDLPAAQRSRLPVFHTLKELNERYHQSPFKHAGLDAALLAISQLSHYLDHAEKHCEDIAQPSQTFLFGLCSGLWAAAAISVAPSLPDLVPVGVEIVLLAFKLGSYVHDIAQQLSPTRERSESWTYIFPGLKQEETVEKLNEFQTAVEIPVASRAYVSAVSGNSIAVSGPPSTLNLLVSKGVLSAKPTAIPVYGPYHAPHIHAKANVERILGLEDLQVKDAFFKTRPRSSVMSCATGTRFPVSDTKSLISSIAFTILNETLMFNKLLDTCVERARESGIQSCLILPLGPTQNAGTLKTALQTHANMNDIVVRAPPPPPESTGSNVSSESLVGKCKLAVVGMAGRFPDADSHERLWELLEKGLDVHRLVPPDRFDYNTHVDPSGNGINKSHTPYGCWIEKPGLFDSRLFNMSPREAANTCPMQRMALTTAYEALEMSGYVPNRTPSTRLDRIGTFYGQTSDDWREINAAQNIDTYFITGGVRAFGPGRINYHFGFSGPSLNIDTACSSSAAAMQVACTALWARDCDTAVVGGLSCMTNPDIFSGLSKGAFLSKKGPCATFDNGADGYCRGDGCASVIVKRLEDAVADQDKVLAVILGTATNHSADAISITHPHGPTQSILSSSILQEAGVDPLDVDYVEMHGTGTQAGDGTEMVSVTNVFAPADRRRPRDRPLYLGTVKANVGHGEAASGVTALIKVLMMLQKNAIPPHVGIKSGSIMNVTFPTDLSDRNVNIAFHTTPFRRKDGKPRRVFVNNFSAAGGNTGLLLEDAPKQSPPSTDPRSHHLVALTAKCRASLIRNAQRLVEWMKAHPDAPLSHIAYTTTARRMHHQWRLSVAGSSLTEVAAGIEAQLAKDLTVAPHQQPGVVFLFTGQGSHYAELGKELYEHNSVFRKSITEFNQLAEIHGLPSFLPLIDGSEPVVANLEPIVIQLGLAAFEMALARLWISWGIQPAMVLGHSLGEYAALQVAGVLSASDVIYLVGHRARLLGEKCTRGTHLMLAVQGSVDAVMAELGGQQDGVTVACINGPRETVLGGEESNIRAVGATLTAAKYKCTQLKVPYAFHTPQVDVILDDFERLARGVTYSAPKIPVISPLLSAVVEEDVFDATYLRRHARESVDFAGALLAAQEADLVDARTVWLEVGPSPVCARMVMAALPETLTTVPSLRRQEECYKTLSETLSTLHSQSLRINFNEYHRDFADSVRLLHLPAYGFEESNYWIQYEGEWCLSKNRLKEAPAESKLSTTTVQKIIKEVVLNRDEAVVEIESDLCQAQLRNAVSGHQVNGAPLCPSSLYGDMAMTVCNYAYKLLRPDEKDKIGFNVAEMEVPKTLIFNEGKEHLLRLKVTANAKKGSADLVFTTGEKDKVIEHAKCKVYFGKLDEWQSEFDRVSYLIKGRIDALKAAEEQGIASKVGRGLAYKLFSALVDYHPRYRGMEEVILDSTTCEATAKICFQTTEADGNFFFSPYHIDSVCHISGFIINGTDAVDSREQVFISHGWGSMRFTEIPQAGKEYRSYIRMQPVAGSKMMAGDAYVFDGDKIIGVTGNIKFQAIPRRVLNTLLPPRGAAAAGAVSAAPARASLAAKATSPKKVASPKKKKETVTQANIGKVNQKLKSVAAQVMDILSAEAHISPEELADEVAFGSLGIDSLLSLTICGKVREIMELDLQSNAFLDYPTVGAFKGYLAQFEKPGRKTSVSSHDSEEDSSDDGSPDGASDSSLTTPFDDSEADSVKGDGLKEAPAEETLGDEKKDKLRKIIRSMIASEMHVEEVEVTATPDLADLGMDSLMSLTILGKLREETGLDFPQDFFIANPSIKDVERALGITSAPPKKPAAKKQQQAKPSRRTQTRSASPKKHIKTTQHPRIGLEEPAPPKPPRPTNIIDDYPNRKASSLLLSGTVRTATKNLFMIPDGSGSATSYTEMSKIGNGWAVWGLFSPYMKTPEEYHCGVYGMATKFIEEMKKRQPVGPYSLAGWSAGGVIAYEIVYQLTTAGEEVEHLVIIDAPCPVTIEPLPQGLHAWFASIGLLGEGDDDKDKKIPEWLLPHFAASVTALSNYDALPIPKDKCPKVLAIWCEDGVCKEPEDPRPEPYPKGHALFLLDNRSDFGPNRWDEYLDADKMVFRHMPGNHFSMMHGKLAERLNSIIKEALVGPEN